MAVTARRLATWLGVPLGLACLALWLAPALALRFALPRLAANAGGAIEVSGAWPALPFGVQASHLRIAREGRELALDDVRAVLWPSGPRLDARVADGTLLVRGEGLLAAGGFVRVQGVALESLSTVLQTPLSLRGRADGIWRFGPAASLEGSVSRGAVVVERPAPLEVPFALLVLSAARDPSAGDWTVSWLDVQGPPLSGSARGKLTADGGLAFDADIRELGEPVRTFFGMLQLPTEPLPVGLRLEGTLAAPRLVARTATAHPSER